MAMPFNSTQQTRVGAGNGTHSGEFGPKLYPSETVDFDQVEQGPLYNFEIVGLTVKSRTQVVGETSLSQPTGTCWHCGTGIMYCVQVKNKDTGEIVDIGTTCAEKVGLSLQEIRELRRAQREADGSAARYEEAAKQKAERQRREEEETRLYGAHGTESRYNEGLCGCPECSKVAPHGTLDRMNYGQCYCPDCVEAAINDPSGSYGLDSEIRLADAETGQLLPAKCVRGKYGPQWVLNEGDRTYWFPYSPAREATLSKKGVTEVEVQSLFYYGRNQYGDRYSKSLHVIELPSENRWHTPMQITNPEASEEPETPTQPSE